MWIENLTKFNNNSLHFTAEAYFLYGDDSLLKPYCEYIQPHIFNFYSNCPEVFQNLFKKTIIFFEYIIDNPHKFKPFQDDKTTFFVRTNLSTVFQFEHFFSNLLHINKNLPHSSLFLGGSFIQDFNGLYTCFSGTNTIFNYNSILSLVEDSKLLQQSDKPDDILLSIALLHKYPYSIILRSMARLDFIEDTRFFCCKLFTNNVSCFRIKTNNRYNDTLIMKSLIDNIYNTSFDIKQFIQDIISNQLFDNVSTNIIEYHPEYQDSFSSKNFKFENLDNELYLKIFNN